MKRTFAWLVLLPLFAIGCAAPSVPFGEPALSFDSGIDPEGWALVPAGKFLMGLHGQETMVDYDYEIMITTVTNTQFASYLNQALSTGTIKIVGDQVVGYYPGDEFHGYRHEEEIAAGEWPHILLDDPGLRLQYDGKTFGPLNGYENRPMVQVTWFGAKSYCDFFNGRLPTEVEWEKAARGIDGRPFPWGHEIQPENANFYSSHDIFEKIVGKLGDRPRWVSITATVTMVSRSSIRIVPTACMTWPAMSGSGQAMCMKVLTTATCAGGAKPITGTILGCGPETTPIQIMSVPMSASAVCGRQAVDQMRTGVQKS